MPPVLTPLVITASSSIAGLAATPADDLWRRKYTSLASGYHFVPFSADTPGVIGLSAIAIIIEVGRRIADRQDDHAPPLSFFSQLPLPSSEETVSAREKMKMCDF